MKPCRIISSAWLAFSILCYCNPAKAQEKVPCLIFSGNSTTEHCINLAKLNRITFHDDGMTISPSNDANTENQTLTYDLFHHIEIGNAIPSISSGNKLIDSDNASLLSFNPDTKTIILESTSDIPYNVSIFNIQGILSANASLTMGIHSISVEHLSPGVYIAIASNPISKLSLKFIIK